MLLSQYHVCGDPVKGKRETNRSAFSSRLPWLAYSVQGSFTASMPAVEVSNVTMCFGKQVAVDDLSLSVPEGAVYW
jgi:hypothetical protein